MFQLTWNFSRGELRQLADELRHETISAVSRTGASGADLALLSHRGFALHF